MKRFLIPLLLASGAWLVWAQTVPVTSPIATAAWTSSTAAATVLQAPTQGFNAALVAFNQTTTITSGFVNFEGSDTPNAQGTDLWFPVPCAAPTTAGTSYGLTQSTKIALQCNVVGYQRFRVNLAGAMTGTGTANVSLQFASLGTPPPQTPGSTAPTTVAISQTGTQNGVQVVAALPAGTNTVGALNQGAAGTAGWFNVAVLPPTTQGTLNTALVVEPYATNATSTSTYTLIKASAANIYGYAVVNPNATTCWLEFYNATAPSLGTAVYWSVPVLGSGGIAQMLPFPVNLTTAFSIATTTAGGGGTACSTGMGVTIYYN